jgi:hypothetical protein
LRWAVLTAFAGGIVTALLVSGLVMLFLTDDRNEPRDKGTLIVLTPGSTTEVEVEKGPFDLDSAMDRVGSVRTSDRLFLYTEGGRIDRVGRDAVLAYDGGTMKYNGTTLIGIAAAPGISIPTLGGVKDLALFALDLSAPPSGIAVPVTGRVVLVELDAAGWSPVNAVGRSLLPNITAGENATYALTAFPPITNVGTAFGLTGVPPVANGILSRSDHAMKAPTVMDVADAAGFKTSWVDSDIAFLDAEMENVVDADRDGTSDDEVLDETLKRIASGDDLVLAHFHSFDDNAHDSGPSGAAAVNALRTLDGYVGRITEAIEGSGRPAMLILFSDHGTHAEGKQGSHGEFRHEDIYSFFSWRAIGKSLEEGSALTLSLDGAMTELKMVELKAMDPVEGSYSLRSSKSNLTNVYEGVPLQDLIALTGINGDPGTIKLVSADGYGVSMDRSWAQDRRVIVAYSLDGGALVEDGPLRLIVPQDLAGEFNAQYCIKFLVRIEVRS